MLKSKVTDNYPLRYESRKEKGVIFENNDMSMRGGKELLAYEEQGFYADIHCYQDYGYQIDVQEKRVNWINLSDEIFNNYSDAKKAVINFIKKRKEEE